jgi:hypothetical protein
MGVGKPRRKFSGHFPHRIWWTRERVLEALKRFYRDFGVAVTGKRQWQEMTRGTGKKWGPGNRYPSYWSVLSHFSSFRAAWRAVGINVDHRGAPWTPEEEALLKALVDRLTDRELAQQLKRTPSAIKKKRIKLGLLKRSQSQIMS